jgi:2-polyprenyl-3-methyl-5-hydroxy-6-metoxy-1,4-benzoquinol methylase
MNHNDLLFDNRVFWDRRYTDSPSLGSGVGSRGANLLHKRKIIEAFLKEAAPTSVLDVGCGDHEVLRDVTKLPGYVGLDVSAVVIASNTKNFPLRQFKRLDFINCATLTNMKFDAVLCMEVLIHQHRRGQYDAFIEKLVAMPAKGGLVSGYTSDPRSVISSDIIAWHEPITDSLYRAGAKSVTIEAQSLETDCLAFVSFMT